MGVEVGVRLAEGDIVPGVPLEVVDPAGGQGAAAPRRTTTESVRVSPPTRARTVRVAEPFLREAAPIDQVAEW
ncbi:hypothetical protein QBA75_31090 [Streptomyces stelliscabiei]